MVKTTYFSYLNIYMVQFPVIINTRNLDFAKNYYCRNDAFKYSWNSSQTCAMPNLIQYLKIHYTLGKKLLAGLRLILIRLNNHRFNHNFENCINPLYSCSVEVESTKGFVLHGHHYTNISKNPLNTVETIGSSILNITDDNLVEILLFENSKFSLYSLNIWIY